MTFDAARAAETLFGATSGLPAADATSATDDAPARTPATALFGESSAGAPGAWTADPVVRGLYGDDYEPSTTEMFPIETALRPALSERLTDVQTILQVPEAARHQLHRQFTAAIRESGLDPNTTGQQLYHLMVDAEVAVARGETTVPDDGDDALLPSRLTEDVLAHLKSWIGPQRGERLVIALGEYVAAHKGLQSILETPGLTSRPGFRPVLDQLIEHVRKQSNI